MALTFGIQPADIPDDAEIGVLEHWDSLGHVELMVALEQSFHVEIPTSAMINLQSLDEIVRYLEARCARA